MVPVRSMVARAGHVSPGAARPVGQPVERGVELDDRAADLPALEPGPIVLVDLLAGEHREHPLRVGVADDGLGLNGRAVLERYALARDDLGHGHAAGEHRARLPRGVGDREADHPHPALDVSPQGAVAGHVPLEVHELDGCGARLTGAAPGTDDPLPEEGGLQALVGEWSSRTSAIEASNRRSIIVWSPPSSSSISSRVGASPSQVSRSPLRRLRRAWSKSSS